MVKIRTLPKNEEAEQSVLGSILIDKDSIHIVSTILKPDHFYNEVNGIIYQAMLSLYEARKPIDYLTLSAQIKKNKLQDRVDSKYLSELVNVVPTAANVGEYAELVKEAYIKRSLIHIGTQIAEMGYLEDQEITEILNQAESSIFSISLGNLTRGFIPIKETLAESFDRIDKLSQNLSSYRGIPTGFIDLDNILSGLQDSNLIILAARPGQGKTAMAMNIAMHIGVQLKVPVGIFSLEMSNEELVDRLLIGQADIDAWRLKTGRLPDNDLMKLSEAMGQLAEAPIFIDDTPGITVSEMRTKARRLHLEHDIGLIIVDYLQLVNPGRKLESRVQEVSIVSQSLKNLARELKVPVLALSQLSRAVEHRGERRPQLADLRESGAIEQDADVVLFLYRVEEQLHGSGIPMQTKLLIAKHRNGPTGEIDLLFKGDRIRFYNIEKKHEESQALAS